MQIVCDIRVGRWRFLTPAPFTLLLLTPAISSIFANLSLVPLVFAGHDCQPRTWECGRGSDSDSILKGEMLSDYASISIGSGGSRRGLFGVSKHTLSWRTKFIFFIVLAMLIALALRIVAFTTTCCTFTFHHYRMNRGSQKSSWTKCCMKLLCLGHMSEEEWGVEYNQNWKCPSMGPWFRLSYTCTEESTQKMLVFTHRIVF